MTGFLEGLSPAAVYHKTQTNFHAAWAYGVLLWAPLQVPGRRSVWSRVLGRGASGILDHRRAQAGGLGPAVWAGRTLGPCFHLS